MKWLSNLSLKFDIRNKNTIENIQENNDFRDFKLHKIPKYKEHFLFIASLIMINSFILNTIIIPFRVLSILLRSTYKFVESESFILKYYLLKIFCVVFPFLVLEVKIFTLVVRNKFFLSLH